MKNYAIFLALSCALILTLCGSAAAASAPAANFTANTTNGYAPLTVQFNDTSTGNPTSWNWNFGDNTTSTLQNPTHTYNAVGAYTVTLNATNSIGSNKLTKTNYITAWNTTSPLPSNNGIDIYVANDAGVKYDMPNGVTTSGDNGGVYPYTPNTYYVAEGGGGTNPIQLSTDPTNKVGQISNTTNQTGTFYVVFSGGIGHLDDAILMLAVNGTIPNDFSVNLASSGYTYTLPAPATSNPATSSLTNITYVTDAVNETFTSKDFMYGTQSWKPANTVNYGIYNGEDMNSPSSQFHLMFIDLDVGGFITGAINNEINAGSITVQYSFNDLSSFAAFGAYGWFSACNWGTGIPQYSNIAQSGFDVQGTIPVANFTANTTSGKAPLNVQFTDTSSNNPASSPTYWLWNFGDGTTSTLQNPIHTYITPGTYTVSETVGNSLGNNTLTQTNYITVSSSTLNVSSINPANGSTNVANNQPITLTFNEPIQAGNAIDAITVTGSDGIARYITKTITGDILTITPLDNWNLGSTYNITIPANAVTDQNGIALTTPYTSTFNTTTTPTITSINPANGTSNVANNQPITLTFNEPIQAGNAIDAITVTGSDGIARYITKTITGDTLTITPLDNWNLGSTYNITIPANAVTDQNGIGLTTPYTSTFNTTTAPTISSINPANGTSNVANNQPITLTFNENIQAGGAIDAITVTGQNGVARYITKTIVGNTLTITPLNNWTPGTTYTINIPANAVTDQNGIGLTTPYTSTFNTGQTLAISSVNPANGTSNVANTQPITLTFNEPIQAGNAIDAITVTGTDGVARYITKTITGDTLVITPLENWTLGSTYTINIPANAVTDQNGIALTTPYVSTFNT